MNQTPQPHAVKSQAFVENSDKAHWHDEALWFIREKRDKQVHGIPEWERLRETASQIKGHTLSKLDTYLIAFEEKATALGAHVHWAKDGREHNQIVYDILRKHQVQRVVKSKSMLTEECHLNPFLEKHGIEVVDTDLGERIVQLRQETPSHIVLPAIHIKKEEVGALFHEHLGTEIGATDPKYLTEAARHHLREKFMDADAGITGVNFAIAETGGIVVCTNEGNADLGVSLPKLHIACMGLEKLIPHVKDLSVFTRLLARSATGQPITTYTSHFHGPRDGGELHIVLLDNGRTSLRQNETYSEALNCIRCGACMNTCPVYRRSGGHSYSATVPGPIGSVLNPMQDAATYQSLPFACSLCGSCTDVCPVKIPLHHQLLTLRNHIRLKGHLAWSKKIAMALTARVLGRPLLFRFFGAIARRGMSVWPGLLNNRFNTWGKQRDLPEPPAASFASWYKKNRKDKKV